MILLLNVPAWVEVNDDVTIATGDDLPADVTITRAEREGVAKNHGDGSGARELRGGWRLTEGDFVAVNAFVISCRCDKSPLGPAPSAHLGDGFLDLILVRRCTRMQYLRYLTRLTNRRKERSTLHFHMPFVEVHRVCAFRLQALNQDEDPLDSEEAAVARGTSVWCVDGEVLRNPNIVCWYAFGEFARSSSVLDLVN